MASSARSRQPDQPGRYDLVTFGETMIRLTATGGARLEETGVLQVTSGGAESNVAVALARLGCRVAWLSALPDNPLGRRIAMDLRGHGVDTSHVIWSPSGRVGVYFMEPGARPRPTRVLYDRADSVVARLAPEALDTRVLSDAAALHLTGITPALSDTCAAICGRLVDAARDHAVPVVLDVNYRARLWSPAQAAAGLEPLLDAATLLLCGAGDARTIWGYDGEPLDVAKRLLDRSSAQVVVVTLAEQGAIAVQRDGASVHQPAAQVDIVDAVGAGDAFAAGFLHRWLDDRSDLPGALRSGVALAALKMTMPGDHALVNPVELAETIAQLDLPAVDIDR